MSRIEATIPDPRFEQVRRLEEELGLTKSQILDEALALFMKAIIETRLGHRVGFVSKDNSVREFTSPTLSLVEWSVQRAPIVLPKEEFDRVQQLTESPPEPTAALPVPLDARCLRKIRLGCWSSSRARPESAWA